MINWIYTASGVGMFFLSAMTRASKRVVVIPAVICNSVHITHVPRNRLENSRSS